MDWLLVSDAPPNDLPPNVRTVTSFEDYRALIASRLGINPAWTDVYKICDVKPALGLVHHAEIAEYDYWGYGDLDVIYGDIRRFYTPDVLVHDVISPHKHIVAGHFVLLRNTPRLITAFQQIPRWKAHLSSARHKSFDEQIFSRLFLPIRGKRAWRRLITPFLGGGYFREQFSTDIRRSKWIDGSGNFPAAVVLGSRPSYHGPVRRAGIPLPPLLTLAVEPPDWRSISELEGSGTARQCSG